MLLLLSGCIPDEAAPVAPSEDAVDTGTVTGDSGDTGTLPTPEDDTLLTGEGMIASGVLNGVAFDLTCATADGWAGGLASVGDGYVLTLDCVDETADVAVRVLFSGADPTGPLTWDPDAEYALRNALGTVADPLLLDESSSNLASMGIDTSIWDDTPAHEHWAGTFEAVWDDDGGDYGAVEGAFDVEF